MKINRSAKSSASAKEILSYIQGDEDMIASRHDALISISKDGDLLFYNTACGIDDSETVLIDCFESDSMGDGWENALPDDVIDWFDTYY